MTLNKNLALVLFRPDSPLCRMRELDAAKNIHCVTLFDGIVDGTDAFSTEFSVVIADLAQTNEKQQNQFYNFYKGHSMKNSIFFVLHDETDMKNLIPGILQEATILLPHPIYESGIIEIAEDCLSKFQEDETENKEKKEIMFALKAMEKGEFSFKRLEEAKSLSTMLAALCPNNGEAAIGLLELMVNCIEHGNLEITFDEKGNLLKEGKWRQEVEYRLSLPKYSYRNARIQFERKSDKIEFIISDDGTGFNANLYLPKEDETTNNDKLFCFHGRGIKLAANICFDQLEFLGNGNQVRATIDL
ncbi:MAG: ATP-binding protein [Sneathiella sp.]|nr:ATP-binding protein [Sneathiella sp.]